MDLPGKYFPDLEGALNTGREGLLKTKRKMRTGWIPAAGYLQLDSYSGTAGQLQLHSWTATPGQLHLDSYTWTATAG